MAPQPRSRLAGQARARGRPDAAAPASASRADPQPAPPARQLRQIVRPHQPDEFGAGKCGAQCAPACRRCSAVPRRRSISVAMIRRPSAIAAPRPAARPAAPCPLRVSADCRARPSARPDPAAACAIARPRDMQMPLMRRVERPAQQADRAMPVADAPKRSRDVRDAPGRCRGRHSGRSSAAPARPARAHGCARWRCRSRAPKPNSPPSQNCVEAFHSATALSMPRRKCSAAAASSVTIASVCSLPWRGDMAPAPRPRHRPRRRTGSHPAIRCRNPARPPAGRSGHDGARARRRRGSRSPARRRSATSTGSRAAAMARVDQQRLGGAADAGAAHLGVGQDARAPCRDRRRRGRRCGTAPRHAPAPAPAPRAARAPPAICRRAG